MVTTPRIKVFSGIFVVIATVLISYNFYIAEETKFDTYGDAADFISLGVSLAKVQKYGHLNVEGGTIQAFRNKNITNREFTFSGYSTWRPPIWPIIISVLFLSFGYNLSILLIFKFALHLLGIIIFYKTLKLLKISNFLLITGTFLYAISPSWQLYSRVFLSEPITFFLLTTWIFYLSRFFHGKSGFTPQAILGGVLILSHPYYIFLPFSVWTVMLLQKNIGLSICIFSTLIATSIVSLWIIRNLIVLETDNVVITTSSGAVMAKGWNKDVRNQHTNTRGDLANEGLVLDNFDYDRSITYNEIQRMKLYQKATFHFIKSHPDQILPILGIKLKSAFNPFPETSKTGILETGRWFFHLISLLAMIYIIFAWDKDFIRSLAIGLVVSTVAITIITYSGFRFRMPQSVLELLFIILTVQDVLQKPTSLGKGKNWLPK